MKTPKYTQLDSNRRVERIKQIRKIMTDNDVCFVCFKRIKGHVRKYRQWWKC